MTTIALLGFGRVGRKVWETAAARSDTAVLFAIDSQPISPPSPIPIVPPDRFVQTCQSTRPDVIIDFSHPAATMQIAPAALSLGISMVVCTTGFSDDQRQTLRSCAQASNAAFLLAPNITPGINVLMLLAKIAGELLPEHDIHITDYHFREKADCPSGTAKKIADALRQSGRDASVSGVRAGSIVGIHEALFAGPRDQITISHQSYTKDIFAHSALDAAVALSGRRGFLEMTDILDYHRILERDVDGE